MTIFRLKDIAPSAFHDAPPGVRWNYDRSELVADGIVHVVGSVLGLVAAVILITAAINGASGKDIAAVSIYTVGLLAMLMLSATYNLFPVSRYKWILRRFDHSAIYVLIAATYTPFIARMDVSIVSIALLSGVWLVAIAGIFLKLVFPGRFDRLAIVLYLAMGWSGVIAYDAIVAALAPMTLWLIAIGGLLYTAGVIFHVWERLRFQNAIWHLFVLAGAACHYTAIFDVVST